jgi:hypothetical protein
MKTAIGLT